MKVKLVKCSIAAPPSRLPGLDRAVNPYRGCAHSCSYCYAQDVTRSETSSIWGSFVDVKVNVVQRLKKELERCAKGVYGVGTVTDPYQPLEEKHELTRGCLSLLNRFGAKASVLTKSDLVLRDIDLLAEMEAVEIGLSVSCANDRIAGIVEPGAPPPSARFDALSALADAGVDAYLMAAPVIPGVSDSRQSLTALIEAAAVAGVVRVVWDSWNPKPIASNRLKKALNDADMRLGSSTEESTFRVRSELSELCGQKGMHLEDAF
ncbi:MAG: radical SAM protein [Methanobacteriota archaeon]|nr:MAG: radical SAM protein [Euryarchaeota archaeon]